MASAAGLDLAIGKTFAVTRLYQIAKMVEMRTIPFNCFRQKIIKIARWLPIKITKHIQTVSWIDRVIDQPVFFK